MSKATKGVRVTRDLIAGYRVFHRHGLDLARGVVGVENRDIAVRPGGGYRAVGEVGNGLDRSSQRVGKRAGFASCRVERFQWIAGSGVVERRRNERIVGTFRDSRGSGKRG